MGDEHILLIHLLLAKARLQAWKSVGMLVFRKPYLALADIVQPVALRELLPHSDDQVSHQISTLKMALLANQREIFL